MKKEKENNLLFKCLIKYLISGILAGLLIGIGGYAFLLARTRSISALPEFLFSIALLTICTFQFSLYTGKICYLFDNFNWKYLCELLMMLIGNLIGAALMGTMFYFCNSEIDISIFMKNKLVNWYIVLLKSIGCGVLVYIAVEAFNKSKNILTGVLLLIMSVMTFMICGFEHSIADIFYTFASWTCNIKIILFILLVIAGNTIGGLIIPILRKIINKLES